MTCIVGVATPRKGVLLGADSLGSNGYDGATYATPKLHRLGPRVALGYTTSYRFGQILGYHLSVRLTADDEPLEWAIKTFVPAVRAALSAEGWLKKESEREKGGTALLAVRDRLFILQDELSVLEPAAPVASCGSGALVADGAMLALMRAGAHAGKPRDLARAALEVAEERVTGVRGPFHFVETKA